jgi:hypothetical protein
VFLMGDACPAHVCVLVFWFCVCVGFRDINMYSSAYMGNGLGKGSVQGRSCNDLALKAAVVVSAHTSISPMLQASSRDGWVTLSC